MKKEHQASDEILAEMDALDDLELKTGISVAPRNKRDLEDMKKKSKHRLPGLSKDDLKLR